MTERNVVEPSVVLITFDRVFDVNLRPGGRGGPPYTAFGFESGGVRHFEVAIPGWPSLRDGMTVSALLERPDDWKTLVGWVSHSDCSVIGPSAAGTRRRARVTLLLAAIAVLLTMLRIVSAVSLGGADWFLPAFAALSVLLAGHDYRNVPRDSRYESILASLAAAIPRLEDDAPRPG